MRSFCLFALLIFACAHADVGPYPMDTDIPDMLEVDGSEPIATILTKMENHFGVTPEEDTVILIREGTSEPDVGRVYCTYILPDPTYPPTRCALHDAPAYRNYENPVSNAEKEIIAYIVNMLGDGSYAKLLLHKGDLERAGAKIDHVHPLRHLSTVFTDEQLKVSMRNIRKKSKVWKSYTGDLGKSLGEEYSKGNIQPTQITHFAQTIQLDPAPITTLIYQQNWKDLIEYLTDAVPRQGNPRRYDM